MKTIQGSIGFALVSLLAVLIFAGSDSNATGQAVTRVHSVAGRSYYVVQMAPKVTAASKSRLEAAGIRFLLYLTQDSFIVSSSPDVKAKAKMKSLPGILSVRDLQPAEVLSPGLDIKYDAEVNSRIEEDRKSGREWPSTRVPVDTTAWIDVRIATLEASAAETVARAVESLGGSNLHVSSIGLGGVTARVRRESLAELAATPGVIWIERDLPVHFENDVARWTIQSNIASTNESLAAPIHAHGIHGEGQIVTIADTGIEITHPMFDDRFPAGCTCGAPGCTCFPPGDAHRKIRAYYSVTNPEIPSDQLHDTGCLNHGTFVSGVVAGDASPFLTYEPTLTVTLAGGTAETGPHDGQAFGARIEVQGGGVPQNREELFYPPIDPGRFPAGTPVKNFSWIHTNSWAGSAGAADYNDHSAQIDNFVHTHPDMTVVFVVGNHGPGTNTAVSESVAKNVIGVGATENGPDANDLWAPGSRGPSTDGRIKPDVLAPTHVWSAEGCQGSRNGPICLGVAELPFCVGGKYIQSEGTSFSAPAVAGSAALVRQYFMEGWYPGGALGSGPELVPSAALIKATIINSAQEISGAGAYEHGNSYPNNDQGWGRVLLDAALHFQGDARHLVVHDDRTGLIESGLTTYSFYNSSASVAFKATLVWTDPPGSPISPTSPKLVNDLDLVVTAPDGHVYCGNQFGPSPSGGHESIQNNPSESCATLRDNLNNVEGVLVLNPMPGSWTIKVAATSVPMAPQSYALVLTGANDQDSDGDPDASDCAPANAAVFHGAIDVCNGVDDNCSGVIDEGFPNCDGDALADCVDPDDDNDGESDATDCAVCNPAANHSATEAIPSLGGTLTACHDGVDNDCDGVVDLDCAIDLDVASQVVNPGVVTSGSVTDLRATSTQSPTTYEVLTEAGSANGKKLTAIWSVATPNYGLQTYDLVVEAFHNASANNDFTFSYVKKAIGQSCDSGWNASGPTITATSDTNTTQRAGIGTLASNLVCVRVQDTGSGSDSQADPLTLDRVYLFPTPTCADGDGDGYTASCNNCYRPTCPALDCDDADAQKSPGVVEGPYGYPNCFDSKDNNCNGLIDAADLQACAPPPPSILASADVATNPGQVITPDFTLTQETDDVWEVFQETTEANKSKLTTTWRFDNVPSGSSHSLRLEAHRTNQGDTDFQFSWSTSPTTGFTDISGALINHPFENEGGQVYPFGAAGVSGTLYIRAKTAGTGTALDRLYVDFMVIQTTP